MKPNNTDPRLDINPRDAEGNPAPSPGTRFRDNTEPVPTKISTDDCLLYAGYKNPEGYGRNTYGAVHRQMYEAVHGGIPQGLEIDHLCEVKSCINPDHLEAVTHQINSERGNRKNRSEYCRRGLHKMEGDNVVEYDHHNVRQCHRCKLDVRNEGRRLARLQTLIEETPNE